MSARERCVHLVAVVNVCSLGGRTDEEDDACFTSLVPPRGRALLPPGHHTLPRSSLSCAPPLTTQLLIPAAAQRDLAWVEPVNIVVVWTSFIFLLSMAWRKRPTGRKEV